ncbi:multicopper oxidase domain-containing protein [Dokdonella sp.]|uniref:multicopper oxidase domain-containing protein n=1 Tax=Dokdonella sp. TaxID=2291710 RepID=UPI0031C4F091|nr:multicopper oxidase domain-containing protein [Dokdonella sp.]
MADDARSPVSEAWPALARTALRVAFGIIWAINAALTWSSDFAVNYVGYLHNAAKGQAPWSAWWFDLWIGIVTPNAALFVWLTRGIETGLAAALLLGFARKTTYLLGALFSLLVWSTAEGFGGPYAIGATNMGAGIIYVLVFIALLVINSRSGPSPYSLDYYLERRWPGWRRVAEWGVPAQPATLRPISWRAQALALAGIAVLLFFLIAGLHSSLNVSAPTPAAAAAAVSPLSLAGTAPVAKARDARLPPLAAGDKVEIKVDATDQSVEIASGVQYQAWTFGDSVPGPTFHVRQGQTVEVAFTNRGTMEHALDFHSAITPPSLHYVDIKPGETIRYSFVAETAGAFLYHCGTPPVLLHIANGMYGAIVVDPATPLPPAAESYVLVQGEWYTQQVAGRLMGANFQKMLDERPDEVVFNGVAFQYRDHPLTVAPGERMRIYFVNAGPSLWSAFHVIGGMFDKVYPDSDPAHALTGVSTWSVGPGEGAVFDVVLSQAGQYTFVDHSMAHAIRGAQGVIDVRVPGAPAVPAAPPVTAAPAVAGTAPPPVEPSGPYAFDAQRGATLYTTHCSACHQASGMGLPGAFPPLKGDASVLDADPARQIDAILHGLHGVEVGGVVYPSAMPPFASVLGNADVADIINHERSSWGNRGKPVTADDVKQRRTAQ